MMRSASQTQFRRNPADDTSESEGDDKIYDDSYADSDYLPFTPQTKDQLTKDIALRKGD